MNNFYTYAYLREDGTPYYIGKGSNGRAYNSNRNIPRPKDKSRILFLKQNLTEEEAFKHEKYMIGVLGRKDLGTGILRNLTEGGEGTSGWIMPEEHKRRISDANRGGIKSERTRKKLSESNKGKTYSDESRKRMSESKMGEKNHFYGKKHSDVSKTLMINKLKILMSGENNPFYGKTHSEETKTMMSNSKIGITNEKKCKPFHLISPLGEIFVGKNRSKFAKEYGLSEGALSSLINNKPKYKSVKGWTLPKNNYLMGE
jgi:hypothetical protein